MTEINDLARQLNRYVQQYTADVINEIEVASKEEATALMQELKQHSPKATGSYRKGWKVKKKGGRYPKYIVYNKTDYQKTHLLEHGHAKRGGGRVAAKVHIAPAAEKAVNAFLDRVEGAIKDA